MLCTDVDTWEPIDGGRGTFGTLALARRHIARMLHDAPWLEPGAFRIETQRWLPIDEVPDCPWFEPHTRDWCGYAPCPEALVAGEGVEPSHVGL